jgi:hypothetical protein
VINRSDRQCFYLFDRRPAARFFATAWLGLKMPQLRKKTPGSDCGLRRVNLEQRQPAGIGCAWRVFFREVFMIHFKRAFAAAALVGASFGVVGSANAAEFFCTPAPGQCSFDGTTGGYSNVKREAGETASDIFHILVDESGQLVLTFTTAKLTFDSASFAGVTFTPVSGQEYLFNIATAGTYDLIVTASNTTNTTASYSGTIDVAAVPEPAMWGMMIGGFAMGGAALRRRRATAVAIA